MIPEYCKVFSCFLASPFPFLTKLNCSSARSIQKRVMSLPHLSIPPVEVVTHNTGKWLAFSYVWVTSFFSSLIHNRWTHNHAQLCLRLLLPLYPLPLPRNTSTFIFVPSLNEGLCPLDECVVNIYWLLMCKRGFTSQIRNNFESTPTHIVPRNIKAFLSTWNASPFLLAVLRLLSASYGIHNKQLPQNKI